MCIKPPPTRPTEDVYRVDTQFCGHPLSGEEQSAALGAIADSRHVSIQLLPNHHIDAEQDLAGFVFSCAATESAARLPFPRAMFACTALYEVLPGDAGEGEDSGEDRGSEDSGSDSDAESEPGAEPGARADVDMAALCAAVSKILEDDGGEVREALAAALRAQASVRFHASEGHEIASPDFVRVLNGSAHYRAALCAALREVRARAENEPDLDCIAAPPREAEGAWDEAAAATAYDDQRAWDPAMPAKAGLYHAFVRAQTREHCRHKLFVVVSGHCARAADAVRNLWLDFREQLSAGELVHAEEMQWLRQTTLRSHGRVAAQLAAALGVRVRVLRDELDPLRRPMAVADSVTFTHDCRAEGEQVLLANNAAFVHDTRNGHALDVFANEGLWVFHGPADPSGANAFGIEFRHRRQALALPANTLRVPPGRAAPRGVSTVEVDPARLPANICVGRAALDAEDAAAEPAPPFTQQFPDEGFMACMSRLGFERDDGVLHLMPLLVYCE